MAIKSAYKTRTPDVPASEKIDVEIHDTAVPDVAAIEPSQPDEATATLLQQIQHLRASEQAQREFATQVAAQRAARAASAPTLPDSPSDRIALWRTQGLDEGDAAFLSEHLEMAERPDLTRLASDEAAEHHQRGTDDHRLLTKEIFDQHLALQQAAPAAPAEPAPAFFAPPPVRSPAGAEPSAMYSAPVSRQAPSTGYRVPSSPSQVKLSPEEMQIAAASGISHTEYARHKLTMLKRKASGELQ